MVDAGHVVVDELGSRGRASCNPAVLSSSSSRNRALSEPSEDIENRPVDRLDSSRVRRNELRASSRRRLEIQGDG